MKGRNEMRFVVVDLGWGVKNRSESENMHEENNRQQKSLNRRLEKV